MLQPTLQSFMPAKCWIAPEIPTAMQSSWEKGVKEMTLRKLQVHTCIEENFRKYSLKSTRENGRCSHKPSSSVLNFPTGN